MTETLKIKGKITAIRNDKAGFQLDSNEWFSNNFVKVTNQKGDEVEVEYKVNEYNGKNYKNYSKINTLNSVPSFKTLGNSHYKENNEAKALTMLVSYSKDLVKAVLDRKPNAELDSVMLTTDIAVWKSYNYFKKQLNGDNNEKPNNE